MCVCVIVVVVVFTLSKAVVNGMIIHAIRVHHSNSLK